MQQADGEFSLVVEAKVIHTYPLGGFDEQDIAVYRDEIIQAGEGLGKWVLFEHPKKIGSLTPEALELLTQAYNEFAGRGCVAIAVEVSYLFGTILRQNAEPLVKLPMLISDDPAELKEQIDTYLSE
ncbi:hypothetical protein [Neptuniibacter caesariensis]|uniref:Uncharacterized protein n=1 Tax=Neptuniibacter caesariensis TaxID=207954 RepID=A0A7U8GRU1_NEPCE|nr:hypothetical protein [Neptuniibacter caesariensis]EAR60490.1 hypothetical protein MED92_09176 [Oceanospirillum sp. MED92] [Neptuniibacter caesariensis]